MKNLILTERPLALPAVRAQVPGVSVRSASGVAPDVLVGHPSVRAMGAGAPQLPQVHQVSRQALLAQARVRLVQMAANYGTNGTAGFRGDAIGTAKQIVDGASGAPPRGRPV